MLFGTLIRRTLALAALLPGLALGEAPGVPRTRVLHFPADRCVGRVKVYEGPITSPDELPGRHVHPEWEFIHEARGDVIVPAGKPAMLEFSCPKGPRGFSGLEKLGPDDLYAVFIDGVQGHLLPNPDESMLSPLGRLTGLREVGFFGLKINGSGLRHLKPLRSLRVLQIWENQKPIDAGLAHLSELSSLEHLDLDAACTDAGLQQLNGLGRLRELLINVNRAGAPGLACLERLPGLRDLTLYGETFSDAKLACVRNLASLTRLKLFCRGEWAVTDAGLAHLSGLTKLEDLDFIHQEGIGDGGMVHLKPLRNLRSLTLEWTQVTDAGLHQLSDMTLLERLRLPGAATQEGIVWAAKTFPLKELTGGRPTDEALKQIASRNSLEILSLWGKGVTDAGMESVAKLTNIRHLSTVNCPLTGKGLAALSPLKSLTTLCVRRASLPVSALRQLNALSNLTRLSIGDIEQDNAGMDLSGLTRLEYLTIYPARNARLRDEDLACLSGLNRLVDVQFAFPNQMAIGDKGLSHLAGLTRLNTLGIGANLTDAGLVHVKNMKSLHRLTLYGDFTDAGLAPLEGLTNLGMLNLHPRRAFSKPALNRLKQTLPGLSLLQAEVTSE